MMKGTHRAGVPTTGRGWILRTNRDFSGQTCSLIKTYWRKKNRRSRFQSLSYPSRGVIHFRLNALSQLTFGHEQVVARL